MAPPAPLFEFKCHQSVASLEVPLGRSAAALDYLAARCDSGDGYEQQVLWVRGRYRNISVPTNALDAVHRRISSLLFPADLSMGEEVNGFVARRSTRSNALPHAGARYLQKFDIKDFFASIQTEQVNAALRKAGFGEPAAMMLGRLVSCGGRLPLGARTSPRVSNLVLTSFDEVMVALAAEQGIVYTRYAGDLSFSSDEQFDVSSEVETELASTGFELNPTKTRSFKFGQPMFVTGLAVSDGLRPRLRKRVKAQLRREFYFVEKYGLDGHAEAIDQTPHRTAGRLVGQFHYARSVEPEFAEKLQAKYPAAFRVLIPQRGDDRVERAQRYHREFLIEVSSAAQAALPVYVPTVALPLA